MIKLFKEFIVRILKEIFEEKIRKIKIVITILYAVVILNLLISTITLIVVLIK